MAEDVNLEHLSSKVHAVNENQALLYFKRMWLWILILCAMLE